MPALQAHPQILSDTGSPAMPLVLGIDKLIDRLRTDGISRMGVGQRTGDLFRRIVFFPQVFDDVVADDRVFEPGSYPSPLDSGRGPYVCHARYVSSSFPPNVPLQFPRNR